MRVALHCRALHAHSEPARDNSAFVVFAGSHRAPPAASLPGRRLVRDLLAAIERLNRTLDAAMATMTRRPFGDGALVMMQGESDDKPEEE